MQEEVNWQEWLYYDESSPTCLRWKKSLEGGSGRHPIEGTIAGSRLPYGRVTLFGQRVYIHRLVWELHNGKIEDGLDVDHIDGDPSNHKIGNLRTVPRSVNLRNASKKTSNTSGTTGVNLHKVGDYLYWAARWVDPSGKVQTKTFSHSKFGEEEAFRLACEHRTAMIEQLNQQGAGYTERHGQ